MDINQVYRAPSIPKLSKRNISSPVLRGAAATTDAKPKLTRSRFSFLKPRISADKLKTETPSQDIADKIKIGTPTQGINETLAETNQILVEIQKQLSLDFAMRIAEEKETLKKVKETESKRKFALKEKSVEAVKKIGGTVGGVINKVTAPVKSIFDKIKEFFGLILTGIVINKAFAWLQDEGNREKLEKIFNFIGTYWKEIAAVLIGLQIAPAIASIVGTLASVAAVLTNPAFLFALSGILSQAWKNKEINRLSEAEAKRRGITKEEVLKERQEAKNSFWGILSDAFSSGAFSMDMGIGAGSTYQRLNLEPKAQVKRAKGGTIDLELRKNVPGYKDGGTFWERMSGTVRGAGSMMVDSVKALLAPGEEIIRATSAMLFRPLLKDINDNAGRLWVEFSDAVKKLFEVSSLQTEVSKEFAEVIEDFDEYLKADITKKRIAGGGYSFNRPKQSSVTPTQKIQNNIIMSPPSSGGMTFLPMMLPKQSSKPPQIPQMNNAATEVVPILPFNITNPWMDVTPELYGIQLYA